MKLLSVETSGKVCGACIFEDKKFIDKIEIDNGLTHSQNLMPIIQDLLNRNNLKIQDFNCFVCDIGPGSFTGIRIGVATVKAFVDAVENTKYTGVSSLETLAYNYNTDGLVCSVIDAKNENCYFALYKLEDNNYSELIAPTACSIAEMLDMLSDYTSNPIAFVGDGTVEYKDVIENKIKNVSFLSHDLNNINSSNLALAGFKKIQKGNSLELSPMYLKKPQAERQLEEKLKKD